jgi:hypothetical protein
MRISEYTIENIILFAKKFLQNNKEKQFYTF